MNLNEKLISWYHLNKRDLPWRSTQNPYYIWISEIVLQQTRVAQGLPYFLNLIENFPTVHHLADAHEDFLLKQWQGLGYYSRARNMHAAAKYISKELGGAFPDSFESISKLKGVGPYTAAAIASFAFDLPHAVVDGNVNRVLSRVFGILEPVNSTAGKKKVQEAADLFLHPTQPALHNQAIMELGALVCTPTRPQCQNCALQVGCFAYANGLAEELPKKIKTTRVKPRNLDYLVLESDSDILFRKRQEKDIWKGLHDFPEMIVSEPSPEYAAKEFSRKFPEIELSKAPSAPEKEYTHQLSHQKITARFWHFHVKFEASYNSLYLRVPKSEIRDLAVPRLVQRYLLDTSIL